MFFVGFKAPSFLHIFAIRKMKSRTPEPELFTRMYDYNLYNMGKKMQQLNKDGRPISIFNNSRYAITLPPRT